MRIWSIHPKYLDAKRLTGVWRETLLARKVLEGKTKGYKNHPQLIRFRQQANPLHFINLYLHNIYLESIKRGYNFDKTKYNFDETKLIKKLTTKISVTEKQLIYELNHLRKKLNNKTFMNSTIVPEPNSIFKTIKGEIESWEKIR